MSEVEERIGEMYPSMLRFARKLTRDQARAEDLCQSACERALSREHQYEQGTNLRSWLFRIVQTQYIDDVRFEANRPTVPLEYEEGLKSSDDVEASAYRHEAATILRRAMKQLNPEHRRILEARYFQQMSQKEAAEALNIEVGTVMSRLSRAIQAMKKLLHNGKIFD